MSYAPLQVKYMSLWVQRCQTASYWAARKRKGDLANDDLNSPDSGVSPDLLLPEYGW